MLEKYETICPNGRMCRNGRRGRNTRCNAGSQFFVFLFFLPLLFAADDGGARAELPQSSIVDIIFSHGRIISSIFAHV